MINGRGWEFEHNGFTYQMVALNGSDKVRLLCRAPGGEWTFGHARETEGRSAHMVAREIHRDITAPVGVPMARGYLTETCRVPREQVRAMSNDDVVTEVTRWCVGGWEGFLRSIGAK